MTAEHDVLHQMVPWDLFRSSPASGYRASAGTDSRPDAHRATNVGNWEEPSGNLGLNTFLRIIPASGAAAGPLVSNNELNQMRQFTVPLLALALASPTAYALTPDFEACIKESSGILPYVEGCYAEELKRLESEMESQIAGIREPDSPDNNSEWRPLETYLQPRISVFEQAQERWLDYRDAECEWEAELFRAGSPRVGPVARITGLSCQIEMTRARISTLRSRSYWE